MTRARRLRRAGTFGLLAGLAVGVVTALAALLPVSAVAVGVAAGLIVTIVVAASVRVLERTLGAVAALEKRLANTQSAIERLTVQNAEVGSIARMSAMEVAYPLPLGGWALGWDAAAILARMVGSERFDTIVELGSGASSIVIGLQLRRVGRGHLWTLDHEPQYAAITRRDVTALGLDPWVTVLDAPLVDCQVGDEHFRWYDLPEAVTSLERIDLVVVDGPPQTIDPEGTPRYPALAMLSGRLGRGSVVFVDDAKREGDRRMLDQWLIDEPRWVCETIPTSRGTAILRWSPSPATDDREAAAEPSGGAPG